MVLAQSSVQLLSTACEAARRQPAQSGNKSKSGLNNTDDSDDIMNARKSQAYNKQASSTYHGDLLHLDRKLNQPCALHAAAKLLCTGKPITYKSLCSTYVYAGVKSAKSSEARRAVE